MDPSPALPEDSGSHILHSPPVGDEAFYLLGEHIPSGLAVYRAVEEGKDFIILHLNRAAENIETLRREDVVGRRVTEVFPGIQALGLLEVLRRVWQSGVSETLPLAYYSDHREEGWRSNRVFRLPGGDVAAVYEDWGRENAVDEHVQFQESLHRMIVENALEGIWALNADLTTVFVNKQMAYMLGYTPQEMAGRRYTDFLAEGSKTDFQRHAEMRQRGEREQYETRLVHRDGSLRVFSVSAVPLFDAQGKFTGSFAMYTDLTAQKQAQETLFQLNERFDLATRAASLGVWDWDVVQDKLVWDERMLSLYGMNAEGFSGTYAAWLVRLHPEDAARCDGEVADVLRGKQSLDTDFRVLLPNGEIRYIKALAQVERNENGEPLRAIGVNYDITGQRHMEEALRVSEEKFRKAFETTPVGMLISRLSDGVFVSFNQAFLNMFDYTSEELVGKSSLEVYGWVNPADREKFTTMLKESGCVQSFETRLRGKDGRIHDCLVSGAMLALDGVTHILASVHDITPLRHGEKALKESEQQYRMLFQTMDSGFALHEIMLNEEGTPVDYRFLEVNPAFERMTGLKREALIGRSVKEVMPNTEREWIERYGKVALSGETIHFENYSAELGRYYEVTAYCPSYGRFAAIFQDVTERKRVAENLLQAQKLASLGTLAAGVAHEINTPLQVITGSAGTLLERLKAGEVPNEKVLPRVERIHENAWRIAHIVRSLLDYARSSEEVTEAASLNDLVKKALQLTDHQTRVWFNIDLQTALAEDLPPLWCNSNKIIQVVINLVNNACDAMPQGGVLSIRTAREPENGRVLLEVSDTGKGIPPEILPNIFDPFFTTKAVGKGTGLGLSIVKGIVEAHRGEIVVDSQPGVGSTFRLYFPTAA